MRMGEYDTTKIRPIKIMFSDRNNVSWVYQNIDTTNELLPENSFITNNRTPAEFAYLKNIKKELENLKEQGNDSLLIKYINGKPTIYDTTDPKYKKKQKIKKER